MCQLLMRRRPSLALVSVASRELAGAVAENGVSPEIVAALLEAIKV